MIATFGAVVLSPSVNVRPVIGGISITAKFGETTTRLMLLLPSRMPPGG